MSDRVATRGAVIKAPRRARLLAALACAAAALGPTPSGAQAPPDGRWRTLETQHFRVTFPEGMEALGRRAADRAERALAGLSEVFIEPPDAVIDLLVTDHVDVSNGLARIHPSDRIVVYARPPVDEPGLGFFDDWLELVITHELAHVLHLDRTVNPVGKAMRAVLGRHPSSWPIFTGFDAPRWTIEGLATWYESRLTDAGRVRGTYHEMVVRTAVLEGAFATVDRAGGESPVWPGGARAYVYGSLFFAYLLERHGEERMDDFVRAVAGQWVPYRLDAAASDAFGVSVREAWGEWERSLAERYAGLDDVLARAGPLTRPERLTVAARQALHPAVSPDGSRLAYVRSDGRSDTQLRVSEPSGEGGRKLVRVNGLGTFAWTPEGELLVSQLEFADPYRYYGDLYRVTGDGVERRITRGARLAHPAVDPGGHEAVAVREGGGTNALVRVDLGSGSLTTLVPPDPDVHWAYPSVSPDGRWTAASRWSRGGYLDVVVLDGAGRVRVEVTRDRAMDLAPRWSPDGRWLVWGSDRTGIPNVLAAEVDPAAGTAGAPRLLTNVRTGAAYPSVDPAGRWLYFSGYHATGWDVERVPFDPAVAPPAPEPDPRFEADRYVPPPSATAEAGPYDPGATLRPYWWEPELLEPVESGALASPITVPSRRVLGWGVGVRTTGSDLVERHTYGVRARVRPDGGEVEGAITYGYAGLGTPLLSLGLSQAHASGGPAVGRLVDGTLVPLYVVERHRSLFGGLSFPRVRWRRVSSVGLNAGVSSVTPELLDSSLGPAVGFTPPPAGLRGTLGITISTSSARGYAFPIGGAAGSSVRLTASTSRELGDASGARRGPEHSLFGEARLYAPLGGPGYAPHVLAGRVRARRFWGTGAGSSVVGGASGSAESVTGLELFGGFPILFPVRGFSAGARAGRTAWVASGEYRFPLRLVNRGWGAWPVHLDRLMGSLFVDAGNAWNPGAPVPDALWSAGAEVTTEVLLFWGDLLRLRTGIALPLAPSAGPLLYLRLGLPF